MPGTLFGVGVGPGDPELLTLKAVRVIQSTPVIAYLTSDHGRSQAREIAAQWLDGQHEVPIPVACQTDRGPANRAYDQAAAMLGAALAGDQDVVFLCEGDPLLYGSFIYLWQRLEQFPCAVIPGISSVGAAAAVAIRPLATGEERVAIVPGTAGVATLRRALIEYDSIAILKPGRRRPEIVQLLRETNRLTDAVYVEQATRQSQRIVTRVDELPATAGPYFALFLITRAGTG